VSGSLYVVATPLGNLDDLSFRALEVLGRVSLIAAEDTRRTRRILNRHDLSTRTTSCHEHNEAQKAPGLLRRLREGEDIALVTDGGTPGVSDPGPLLVRRAAEEGIRVVPVPGPSAIPTLLSVSGIRGDAFVFHGFLPHRAGERRRLIEEMAADERTQVFYDSPKRIAASLRDAAGILGERRAVVGRELTKRHEELLRGTLPELAAELGGREEVLGEVAVVVEGRRRGEALPERPPDELVAAFREGLEEEGGDRRAAVKRAAREVGLTRSEAFRRLQQAGEV
jgi:16S rRNA (cytidine1402-2'-O)-methyltransferase